jgi:hypothetical protein
VAILLKISAASDIEEFFRLTLTLVKLKVFSHQEKVNIASSTQKSVLALKRLYDFPLFFELPLNIGFLPEVRQCFT